MDIRLHFQVLRRFRYLVLGGFVLGAVLCFFSYAHVDVQHGFKLSYRQAETWRSSEVLLLTQKKSPLFSANPADASTATGWLTALPPLYAEIANSDIIARAIRADHSLRGKYEAFQVFDTSGGNGSPLPFLQFDAISATRGDAVRLATSVSDTFRSYVTKEQVVREIPDSDRVLVHVVTPASLSQAKLIQARSKTIPLLVFLVVLAAAVGLAYILENLRPSVTGISNVAPVESYELTATRAPETLRQRV